MPGTVALAILARDADTIAAENFIVDVRELVPTSAPYSMDSIFVSVTVRISNVSVGEEDSAL